MFLKYEYKNLDFNIGMSNSCISVFTDQKGAVSEKNPSIIPNHIGELTTPSFVCIDDINVLVGKDAKNQWPIWPNRIFYGVRSFIGRSYSECDIASYKKILTYEVYKDKNDLPYFKAEFKEGMFIDLYPEQISSFILGYLKKCADTAFYVPTNDVVITVPANFSDIQRRATKDAALIADLNPIDVISEPVAASITYAYYSGYKEEERNILIYNFCDCSLDAALVNIKGGTFTILATAYDSNFGGSDVVQHLYNIQIKKIRERHGINIFAPNTFSSQDKYSRARSLLMEVCEKAIISLSAGCIVYEQEILDIITLDDNSTINFVVKIVKYEFESYLEFNKDKLLGPVRLVLTQSKIKKSKINALGIVVESYRIPKVIEMVENEVGQIHYMPLNPYSAIADGGAIYCAYRKLTSQGKSFPGFKNFEIKEITPMGIGISTIYHTVELAIPRNSPIPVQSVWQRYLYRQRGPSLSITRISIHVYEGDSTKDSKCHYVGKFDVEIPEEDKRECIPIYIRISVDKEGITLEVALSDEEPKSSSAVKKYHIKKDTSIHSSKVIAKQKDQCKDIMNRKPPEPKLPFFIKLTSINNKMYKNITKCVEKKIKDREKSRTIRLDCIKYFLDLKSGTKEFDESNPMTEEVYNSHLNDLRTFLNQKIPGLYEELMK